MSEKFSPGPWHITEEDWEAKGDISVIYDNDGKEVLGINGYIKIDEPDLRLMSAAPDMYEALECACDKYCIGWTADSLVKCEDCIILKALRKAQGEEGEIGK